MPTLPSMQIPPPTSADEFEDVTLSALRLRWNTADLQRNGRSGQAQAGVDIFGEDNLGCAVGVQCKLVERGGLDVATVEAEVAKAERFEPRLEAFYMATTGPRDARLQKDVRILSKRRTAMGGFPVGILFWDDITFDLAKDPAEFKKHYPNLLLDVGGVLDLQRVPGPPKHPLVVLPIARTCWWYMGGRGRAAVMQVSADVRVTNTSDWPIHVHSAALKTPLTTADQIWMTWPGDNRASVFPVPPGETLVVRLLFWIDPPVLALGDPLVTDVVLVDQFGNKHWTGDIEFESRGGTPPAASGTPPGDPPIGDTDRRVLNVVTSSYLASGNAVTGRQVRLQLRDVEREAVNGALGILDPARVRRGVDEPPHDTYVPTLKGLMESSEGPRVRLFIAGLLTLLRERVVADPAFRTFTSKDLSAAIIVEPPASVPFMHGVLSAAQLCSGGVGHGQPLTSFEYGVPQDVEDVIDCQDVDVLAALRAPGRAPR